MPDIKRNFFYQSLNRLILVLTPLITAPYIARVLGAEGIGISAYTTSVASYFTMFAMLGFYSHGRRAIARIRDDPRELNATFSNIFFFQAIISIIAIIAFIIFLVFGVTEFRVLLALQLFLVITPLVNIRWLFTGLENIRFFTLCQVIVSILVVACVFIFVNDRSDLAAYILIMALGIFLPQALVWFHIKRYVSFVKPTWTYIKAHIKPILVLFIPVVAVSVYTVLNRIMLSVMSDNVQLGFFVNSMKLVSIPMGFISTFNAVMLPRMSNIIAGNKDAGKQNLTTASMRYVMLIAFAMTFGIAAIANNFAPLFFGSEFDDVGIIVMGLCLMIPFLAFSNTLEAHYIMPHSLDKLFSGSAVLAAVLSLVANFIFIPRLGAMGAVIGVVAAESIRCIILAIYSRKALPLWTYVKNSFFFLFTGIAMFFLVYFIGELLSQSILSVIAQISIGIVFYLGLSAVYLYKVKDEVFHKWVCKTAKKRS